MAKGINKVILIGNLGQDPETRYMPNGGAVTNLRIATTDSWKDRDTGEKQERTEWHSVTMYQKLAEIAGQYLRKGSQVFIEGSLRTRKWQDKNGQDRYTTEIIASDMQMLGGRAGSGGGGAPRDDYDTGDGMDSYDAPRAQPAPSAQPARKPEPRKPMNDDFDDDIPF